MNTDQLLSKISGLSVVFWLAVALAGLSGCQSSQYQPEGRDVWQSVRVGR